MWIRQGEVGRERQYFKELTFCLGLFPVDRQHDAQTQASAGSAISHRYTGGNVEEGLLFGLARSVCSFALNDGLAAYSTSAHFVLGRL